MIWSLLEGNPVSSVPEGGLVSPFSFKKIFKTLADY